MLYGAQNVLILLFFNKYIFDSSLESIILTGAHMVAGRTFVHYNSFTSGYIFGARLDVMYEQLLQNQEVSMV